METSTSTTPYKHRIRSFVRREDRLTDGQQRALDELLPRYGAAIDQPIDLAELFDRAAPTILEIGFGNGASLLQMARAQPDWNYLGVEVHRPGIGHLLLQLEQEPIDNIRIVAADAQQVLKHLPADSLHGLQLYFPDPWHKKRHHKRRLVQAPWAQTVRQKLLPGGFLHMATDWENYAEHMLDVLAKTDGLRPANPAETAARLSARPPTRFELRGRRKGHDVWELVYIRSD